MDIASQWYAESLRFEHSSGKYLQRFTASRITPETLDSLLADGWRHFGEEFFRDKIGYVDNSFAEIIPLRINLKKFVLSKSHRRTLSKNTDVKVEILPANIDSEAERVYKAHTKRLPGKSTSSLYDILSDNPSIVPCMTIQIRVTVYGELAAVSYADVGKNSISSVYAVFDPKFSRQSLGIFTLLKEIEFAWQNNRKFLYLGYAYREPSIYDYKKQFAGTEYYNWHGKWLKFTP